MSAAIATISSITTYPIKGLAGHQHQHITVQPDALLAGDRAYALSSGTQKSCEAPRDQWLKKAHFLQMMNHKALADFDLSFDVTSRHLTLHHKPTDTLFFDGLLSSADDCALLCQAIADKLSLAYVPRLFELDEGGMTDTKTPYLSFGNHASISDFAGKAGLADDARRFRLNVMMTGLPAFGEHALIGKRIEIGTATFAVIEPVGRCAAIEVDPQTAERKKGLVQRLRETYGHEDMGVFVQVIKAGQFACGDEVRLA